jgi:transglutaminase-like putative cysteine protease
VLGQCLVGVVGALYLCVPSAMPFGLPTPVAFGELFSLLGQGVDDIYSTIAPAPSTPGFTAILVVGIGLITILIDGLVSDLRAPKMGGILLLLIWVIPVIVAGPQLQWFHFAAIGLAFVVLMLSRYLAQRVRRAAAFSVLAGALALLLGVGLPLVLPPVDQRPQQPLGTPEDITVVNPFLDLHADLDPSNDDVVLTYTTEDPLAPPLRLTSVSAFDGTTWMPEPFDIDPFAVAVDGMPRPEGVAADTPVVERTAEISIQGLDEQHLPSPYSPATVDGVERRWIYDPSTLTIVGNGVLSTDAQYTIGYRSIEPTPAQLAQAQPVDAEQFESTLALPNDVPEVIGQTAEEVTAGSENQWEAAVALQDWLRSDEFEYSLDAPADASGSALEDFLRDRRGYCVQFSGAMTAMARSLGIPARIGVGFTAGTPTGDGEYEVRMNQAHAWPELYFEGAGWVRFEPTPGGPAGDPPPWTTEGDAGEDEAQETEAPEEESSPQPTPGAEESAPQETQAPEVAEDGEPTGAGVPLWLAIAGGVVLLLLLLAVPALLRLLQRRSRLSGDDAARTEGVWEEIAASTIDAGRPWDRSRTLRDQHERIAADLETDDVRLLEQATEAAEALRYGDGIPEGTALSGHEAARLVQRVRATQSKEIGPWSRVRAVVLPRSLTQRPQAPRT